MLKSVKEIYSWKYESCDMCGSCFKIMYEVKDETWLALMEEVIDEGLYFNDIINNSKLTRNI